MPRQEVFVFGCGSDLYRMGKSTTIGATVSRLSSEWNQVGPVAMALSKTCLQSENVISKSVPISLIGFAGVSPISAKQPLCLRFEVLQSVGVLNFFKNG